MKNLVINNGDYAEIVVVKKNSTVQRVKVSKSDVIKIKAGSVYVGTNGYARISRNSEKIYLHRLFVKTCTWVDHINGDKLDNRAENLRPATPSQNGANRSKFNKNTGRYPGIYFDKKYKRYRAHIMVNRKRIWLGSFNEYQEALKARKNAEEKYFGEFRAFL